MAIIHLASSAYKTRGEEKVLSFFKYHLPDSWHVFYEPLLDDLQPDFVLFSPYYGALIVEVKDYTVRTINKLAPDYWEIVVNNIANSVLSPYVQSRQYKHKLCQLLKKRSEFCSRSGIYQGKVLFPVMCLCWFVNITANDARVLGIPLVMPEKFMLTKEQFDHPNSIEVLFSKILTSKFIIKEIAHQLTSSFIQLLNPTFFVPGYAEIRKMWFREFQSNVRSFPSLVDEVLYIATEIRHIYASGVPMEAIALYVHENRYLKESFIKVFVQNILSDMGITGVALGELDDYRKFDEHSYIFIMDLKEMGMDEKREASLSELLNEASKDVYFTSSCLEQSQPILKTD